MKFIISHLSKHFEKKEVLKDIDFTGKVVRPFVTHEGSGLANIPSQIKKVCRGAEVIDGLAVKGSLVNSSKDKVGAWI